MRLYKVFTFIISTVLAFIVFGAIALGIQAMGLVSVAMQNAASNSTTISILPTSEQNFRLSDQTVELISQLDIQEQAWLALGISSYRIDVEDQKAWWGYAVSTTVVNGEILDQSVTCLYGSRANGNENCSVENPADYTIAGLFALGHQLPTYHGSIGNIIADTNIVFEATYHIPISMSYTPTNAYDMQAEWTVVGFELLR